MGPLAWSTGAPFDACQTLAHGGLAFGQAIDLVFDAVDLGIDPIEHAREGDAGRAPTERLSERRLAR
jgi:hypothetical protein